MIVLLHSLAKGEGVGSWVKSVAAESAETARNRAETTSGQPQPADALIGDTNRFFLLRLPLGMRNGAGPSGSAQEKVASTPGRP
jgi:hypothetical protein